MDKYAEIIKALEKIGVIDMLKAGAKWALLYYAGAILALLGFVDKSENDLVEAVRNVIKEELDEYKFKEVYVNFRSFKDFLEETQSLVEHNPNWWKDEESATKEDVLDRLSDLSQKAMLILNELYLEGKPVFGFAGWPIFAATGTLLICVYSTHAQDPKRESFAQGEVAKLVKTKLLPHHEWMIDSFELKVLRDYLNLPEGEPIAPFPVPITYGDFINASTPPEYVSKRLSRYRDHVRPLDDLVVEWLRCVDPSLVKPVKLRASNGACVYFVENVSEGWRVRLDLADQVSVLSLRQLIEQAQISPEKASLRYLLASRFPGCKSLREAISNPVFLLCQEPRQGKLRLRGQNGLYISIDGVYVTADNGLSDEFTYSPPKRPPRLSSDCSWDHSKAVLELEKAGNRVAIKFIVNNESRYVTWKPSNYAPGYGLPKYELYAEAKTIGEHELFELLPVQ